MGPFGSEDIVTCLESPFLMHSWHRQTLKELWTRRTHRLRSKRRWPEKEEIISLFLLGRSVDKIIRASPSHRVSSGFINPVQWALHNFAIKRYGAGGNGIIQVLIDSQLMFRMAALLLLRGRMLYLARHPLETKISLVSKVPGASNVYSTAFQISYLGRLGVYSEIWRMVVVDSCFLLFNFAPS